MQSSKVFQRSAIATALTAMVAVFAAADAVAAGAVTFQSWNGVVGDASIGAGDTLTAFKDLPKSNYSDNPSLNFSAWAHAGGSPWWTFQLTEAVDTTIRLEATTSGAAYKPAMTVWASGNEKFDGGESAVTTEVANNGWDTPHSFNAVGELGSFGTYWMSGDGVTTYSNMKQTLAYGVTGPSHDSGTGWGESILQGVHDVSVDNTYESGVAGSTGSNWLEISFTNLQPGWYVIFAGGSDHSLSTQNMTLSVNTAPVPEPETWAMLAAGLVGMAFMRRKQRA